MSDVFEFRGVDNFYFAEVIKDDSTGYQCSAPIHIPVQEIAKSTDSYYNFNSCTSCIK